MRQLIKSLIPYIILAIIALSLVYLGDKGFPIKPLKNENKYEVYSGRNVYEYWRTTLDENEQKLYDEIKEAYLQFDADFSSRAKGPIKTEDAKKIYQAVFLDHPEIFWMSNSYGITQIDKEFNIKNQIYLKYNYDSESAKKVKETIEANSKEIIEEANKLETEYDKVKYVHDKFIEMGMYNKTHSSYNVFQSIVELFDSGETVCAGFSYGFKFVMDHLGMEAISCVSTDHAWNMVKIDGKWYNLDITWDNSESFDYGTIAYNDFLKSNEDFYTNHDRPDNIPETN